MNLDTTEIKGEHADEIRDDLDIVPEFSVSFGGMGTAYDVYYLPGDSEEKRHIAELHEETRSNDDPFEEEEEEKWTVVSFKISWGREPSDEMQWVRSKIEGLVTDYEQF